MALLKDNGPLVVSADYRDWGSYKGGIFMPEHKRQSDVKNEHVVMLTGYGSEYVDGKKVDYWNIKNSWLVHI